MVNILGGFAIFDVCDPEGHQLWIRQWEDWPLREVWAHPNYVSLFARPGDRVVCLAWKRKEGGILFPLILRSLESETWATNRAGLWDATSAYGYGGPFGWSVCDDDVLRFWGGFRDWASEIGLVSVFARLSLFPSQLVEFQGDVVAGATNVIRALDVTEDFLWRDYAHKVRKNVKRARKNGLTVEVDSEGKRLDAFMTIYNDTMERRQALQSYFFPRSFFDSLCRGIPGQYLFFHVLDAGEVISTELVLVSAQHIYSFLGGTKAEAFEMRPNDLLKHEIICWGRSAQKSAYVLGGGYCSDDGIYRYKHSFAPGGDSTFKTGQMVLAPDIFRGLITDRMRWEENAGRQWQPKAGFFPPYRS